MAADLKNFGTGLAGCSLNVFSTAFLILTELLLCPRTCPHTYNRLLNASTCTQHTEMGSACPREQWVTWGYLFKQGQSTGTKKALPFVQKGKTPCAH